MGVGVSVVVGVWCSRRSYVRRMVADGERYRVNHVAALTQRLQEVRANVVGVAMFDPYPTA